MAITQVLMIGAMICFLLALIGWPTNQQVRMIAAGLFLWVLVILIGGAGGVR